MAARIVLIGLLMAGATSIGPAAAQPIADPPAKPEAPSAAPDQQTPEAFRKLLSDGATVRYLLLNRDQGHKSTLTLRHLRGDEYARSDGARMRDLRDLISDAEFLYSPPIPLTQSVLVAGQKWKYVGTVSERGGITSGRIDCEFRVAGMTRVVTPEGGFDAMEIVETRQIGASQFVAHRFVDEKRGLVVKEVWTTIRGGHNTKPGIELRTGRMDFDMTFDSVASIPR